MSESPASQPIEAVRRIYEAFARGDLDAVMAHCSPDAVIAQDPALPWGGRYVGRDGVATFAMNLMSTVDTAVVPGVIFQAGDRVVQCGRSRGTVRHNEASYDVAECHVWTFSDGLVIGAEFYIDSEKILELLAS
jgi:ketosteroid isomerase-like protein